MASNTDFVQYIVDQSSDAGEISVKKTMGDFCIYCDGTIFVLVCDDKLFIKPSYQGAKEHFLITNVDGIALRVYCLLAT